VAKFELRNLHRGPDGLDIGQRDMEVVQFIAEEGLLGFTFEGLKRRLGTHPETLSRILDRLEEQRVLEKTENGYRVTQRGREVAGVRQLSTSEARVTLLKTLLPNVENPRDAILQLRGRWFGALRWLGYSDDEKGIGLKWITEDGSIQVDAIFSGAELTIEGRIREGRNLTDAIKAAHLLVGHISKVYPAQSSQRMAYYLLGDRSFAPN
jgi:hypothetical protein